MVIGNIPSPAKVSKANTSIDMLAKVSQGTSGAAFQDMMNMSAGKAESMQTENTVKDMKLESDAKDVMDMESKVDNILNDSKASLQPDKDMLAEELNALKEEITAAVKEALGLTDEELEQFLAENGLVVLDLIIPQNLVTLVTAVKADGDAMKLLTNGDVSDTLMKLNSKIQDIVSVTADDLSMTVEELGLAIEEYQQTAVQEEEAKTVAVDSNEAVAQTVVTDNAAVEADEVVEEAAEYSDNQHKNVRNDNSKTDAVNENVQLEDNITIKTTENTSNEGELTNQNNNSENLSNQFVQTLVENVEGQLAVDEVFESYHTNAEDVVRQLIESIKVNVTQTTSSMELQLYPEHLGKIQITVASKEGIITAQIAAQNENVKAVIENQLISLKTTMNEQGLKVDAVEVTVASHSFENGRNFEGSNNGQTQQEKQNRIRHINLDIPDEELTDTEQLAKQMMQANGGSVEYMA